MCEIKHFIPESSSMGPPKLYSVIHMYNIELLEIALTNCSFKFLNFSPLKILH